APAFGLQQDAEAQSSAENPENTENAEYTVVPETEVESAENKAEPEIEAGIEKEDISEDDEKPAKNAGPQPRPDLDDISKLFK
ncbi:MAG: hypothetical protein V1659_04710, partial [Candidatus Woesearchaeota archaeon]